MKERQEKALENLRDCLTEMIGEPWQQIYWRSLIGADPWHYFYYLPKYSDHFVYWVDSVTRTSRTEEDLLLGMAKANEVIQELWKAWIEENAGRSPWTIATCFWRGENKPIVEYIHRHRHQLDPVQEQFSWEIGIWGQVYIPYRMQQLRKRLYSRWKNPRCVRHRHPWRSCPQSYWECLPQMAPIRRGRERVRHYAIPKEVASLDLPVSD